MASRLNQVEVAGIYARRGMESACMWRTAYINLGISNARSRRWFGASPAHIQALRRQATIILRAIKAGR